MPVQRDAVRAAKIELLDIAVRLRADPPSRQEGVYAARRLLCDGVGPLFAPAERDRLKIVAQDVLRRL